MSFIRQKRLLTLWPNIQPQIKFLQNRYIKLFNTILAIQFLIVIVLLILTSGSSLLLRSSAQVNTAISTGTDVEANQEANQEPNQELNQEPNQETKPISELNIVEPIPVDVIDSSENTEIDLRLGYSNRGLNCQFFSETAVLVLQEELNLNTTLIAFETENELFDALTERKIDLTFCFLDPLDRIQLIKAERLGHIRQIGAYYWADEHKKLQIWAHTYAKTELRTEIPCVYHFLENIRFAETALNEHNPLAWYQNHTNEVHEWLKCTS